MRAIILAAGEGKRLRPLTEHQPKAMVEVRGRSLLERQLIQLHRFGILDVIIVTGYYHHVIDTLAEKYSAETIMNDQFSSTNMVYSLSKSLSALDSSSEEDCLILYGDIAYSDDNLLQLISSKSIANMSVLANKDWQELWSLRLDDPLTDAETFIYDEDLCLIEIGKKPDSYDQVQAQYMGMIKVRESFLVSLLENYLRNTDSNDNENRNLYMTDLIQDVANSCPVYVSLVEGEWIEMDTIDDYKIYSNEKLGDFGVF